MSNARGTVVSMQSSLRSSTRCITCAAPTAMTTPARSGGPGLPFRRLSDHNAQTGHRSRVDRPSHRSLINSPLSAVAPPRSPSFQDGHFMVPLFDESSESSMDDQLVAKPRIVILGSGWGAMSIMTALPKRCKENYDLVVVSPRNYFLYTPLLPSVATGTCEERSIVVHPVRSLIGEKGKFIEAECTDVDPENKMISLSVSEKGTGLSATTFQIPYDVLVVTVGSATNTFGVPGVEEHCLFMKTMEDAKNLRRKISELFERASLPNTTDEERYKMLSFVVVGGGPTGIEISAEMNDLVNETMKHIYPDLMKYCSIRVVASDDHVLSTYDQSLGDFTERQFRKMGIKTLLNSRAVGVTDDVVQILDENKQPSEVPYGLCVWATGIKMNPLVQKIQDSLGSDTQRHSRCLVTDPYLRVKGSNGSIYCLGDAGTITQEEANAHATELFKEGDINGDGKLQLHELRNLLLRASKTYPQLKEHAAFLDGKAGGHHRLQYVIGKALHINNTDGAEQRLGDLDMSSELSLEQFEQLLLDIDAAMRPFPATAQVAAQQGSYLAKVMSKTMLTPEAELEDLPKFGYTHKGALAYVGRDKAVLDAPVVGPIFGRGIGVVWKGFESIGQFSLRNRVLVTLDWFRTKFLGRDISDI